MKDCRKCKEDKEEGEFYKDYNKYSKDGLQAYCKKCSHKVTYLQQKKSGQLVYSYRRKWLLKYSATHKKQIAARNAVKRALYSGKLSRDICFCGEVKVQAHHHKGYESENYLDVLWLCQKHHTEAHHAK